MTTVHPEPITETHGPTCPCINCALGVPPFAGEPVSHAPRVRSQSLICFHIKARKFAHVGWFAYMNSLPVHTESCRDEGCKGTCLPERPSDE